MQHELGVGLRAWLRLEPSRGVYCVAYRQPGGYDTVYAGRTPTQADYDAARADPVGVAVSLIRQDLAARSSRAGRFEAEGP